MSEGTVIMDAAARAELDALRQRAYGPAADIADDPAALERLIELEEHVLPSPTGEGRPDTAPWGEGSAPGPTARSRMRRKRWHVALAVAVAVVAVPLGAGGALQSAARSTPGATLAAVPDETPSSVRDALAFVDAPGTKVLITLRIDGSFGDFVDIPSNGEVPNFPAGGTLRWVEQLGDYYGWKLWIAGADGPVEDENCLLLDGSIDAEGPTRARCVTIPLQSQGALLLSVPFAAVDPDERPPGMTADQSLGYWWATDGTVKILLGPTPTR